MDKDAMDKRHHHRQRVARPGRLSFGGSGTMPCSIRDTSHCGARLEVTEGAGWVLNAVDVQDVMTGVTRKGIVVWRVDTRIGIRFVDQGAWPVTCRRPGPIPFGRRAP